MIFSQKGKKGVSIVEILITIAIIGLTLVSLFTLATTSLKTSISIKETTQAKELAQEMMEAVRSFRDGTAWLTDGIGTLTLGVAYYPKKSTDLTPKWQLVQGEETINGFKRKIVFNNVQRDVNDNVVESGGVDDSNTKKITATVLWKGKKVEIVTYLTNWRQ